MFLPFYGIFDTTKNMKATTLTTGGNNAPLVNNENNGLSQLLIHIGKIPNVIESMAQIAKEMRILQNRVESDLTKYDDPDRWLSAKAAMTYLSMSASTFDKYRYNSDHSIKGYLVGSKTLYKKTDLDSFVKLWKLKSSF